jgi:hypothetical protein
MAGRLSPRRLAACALVGAVLLGHGWGIDRVAALLPAAGRTPTIQRLTVAYVHELKPQAPPAAAPLAAAPRLKAWRVQAAAAPAASAVEPLAPVPPLAAEPSVALAAPQFDAPPAAARFEWPPSTRLVYTLRGDYRGPLEGDAQVHWVRIGERYQVQMDVTVGLALAPLMSRRVTSDGLLGDDGLAPRRYEERTRLGPAAPTFVQLVFDPARREVLLAGGRRVAAPAGVQDSASQFVQLAWLFNMQPQRLRAGERIELPLALARRVGAWVYEVQPAQLLDTPLGAIDAHELAPQPGNARAGELAVQLWIAPALQYLPVRIRIEQAGGAWVDLTLAAPPLQEAGGG